MKRLALLLILLTALLGLVSAASADTPPGEQHWRKSAETGTNRQYLIYVHYDTDTGFGSSIDPSIRDNYTAQFSSELNQAIAKLDAHPDLRVVRETSSSIPCHDNWPNPASEADNRNCVEFHRVSAQWLFERSGGISGVIGLASWWQNPDHIWNDGGGAADENTWMAVYHGLSGGSPVTLDNVFCHELAHTFDLNHPTDGTPGPCDGSGHLDADDNSALDLTYCTRHVDPQLAPRGSTLVGSDVAGGTPDPECAGISAEGAALSATESSEILPEQVTVAVTESP